MNVYDKLVLITGANRGIGLAFAKEAHACGARLLLAMRDPSSFKEDWIDTRVETIALDLSSRTSIENFLKDSRLDKVDILINNAGQLTGGLLENQGIDEIYSMFQVNLVGLIHLTHGMMPKLIARPSAMIVNNSSVSGVMHLPCTTTYTAAKTGVSAFSSSLRQDLSGTNVKVLTLITPGIKTRMFDEIAPKYTAHMDVSNIKAITPELYAKRVFNAIERDEKILLPPLFSLERVGVFLARHFPLFFEWVSASQFKR